jgi:hypothetical protein
MRSLLRCLPLKPLTVLDRVQSLRAASETMPSGIRRVPRSTPLSAKRHQFVNRNPVLCKEAFHREVVKVVVLLGLPTFCSLPFYQQDLRSWTLAIVHSGGRGCRWSLCPIDRPTGLSRPRPPQLALLSRLESYLQSLFTPPSLVTCSMAKVCSGI